ncbi:MAG: hypothetical protein WBI07_15745 [Mobilitalea sp.]
MKKEHLHIVKILHTQICACSPKFASFEKGKVLLWKTTVEQTVLAVYQHRMEIQLSLKAFSKDKIQFMQALTIQGTYPVSCNVFHKK